MRQSAQVLTQSVMAINQVDSKTARVSGPAMLPPAPLIGLGAVVAGFVLDGVLPFQGMATLGSGPRIALAAAAMLLGAWFILAARWARRQSRERAQEQNLTVALTTTGIYANAR